MDSYPSQADYRCPFPKSKIYAQTRVGRPTVPESWAFGAGLMGLEPAAVKMTLHGRVVDPAYSRMLIQKAGLSIEEVCALDRVQKGLPLDEAMVKRLRRAKLIEGRRPHLHVAAAVASATATKADYIRTRGQDDTFYAKLITDYLTQFGSATRREIDGLLWDKLSDALDDEQKRRKVGNLLTHLRNEGVLHNLGSRRYPKWALKE